MTKPTQLRMLCKLQQQAWPSSNCRRNSRQSVSLQPHRPPFEDLCTRVVPQLPLLQACPLLRAALLRTHFKVLRYPCRQ